jgi:flagellar protein FlaG
MNNDINTSLRSILPTPDRTGREPRAQSGRTENSAASATTAARSVSENATLLRSAQEEKPDEQNEQPVRSEVEEAASELARRAEKMGRDLRFEVDDDSGMTVVKVIDRSTDEVVRQIPSEEAVARAADSGEALNLINASA